VCSNFIKHKKLSKDKTVYIKANFYFTTIAISLENKVDQNLFQNSFSQNSFNRFEKQKVFLCDGKS